MSTPELSTARAAPQQAGSRPTRRPQALAAVLLACLAALWASWPAGAAPPPPPRFEHLGVPQGLPQASVLQLIVDSRGFLWAATQDGLCRYDGYGFKVFRHDPADPRSLSDNNIQALTVDSRGALWVGTRNGGLCRYDPGPENFTRYQPEPGNSLSVSSLDILAMADDSQGRLWVATGKGLGVLHPETKTFVRSPQALLKGKEVVDIAKDKGGRLWLASNAGLYQLDPATGAVEPCPEPPQSNGLLAQAGIITAYPDTQDILWVATQDFGLLRLDLSGKPLERHLPGVRTHRILRDSAGVLWAATSGGLAQLTEAGAKRTFQLHAADPLDPQSLSQNDAVSLTEDPSGVLWVGTYHGGLNKLLPSSKVFRCYRHASTGMGNLPVREVNAVLKDSSGLVWAGGNGMGLAAVDRERKSVRLYVHDDNNPKSLADNTVTCLMEDSLGRIWAGAAEKGISILDKRLGVFSHIAFDARAPQSAEHNRVTCLFEDRDKAVWIGTRRAGLSRLDPSTGRITRFTHDETNPASISHDRVRAVGQTRDGTIWVVTNAGLDRLDQETGRFTHARQASGGQEGLPENLTGPVVEDSLGGLWVGASEGLYRYDPATGKNTRITERDGLANGSIQALAMDSRGVLWMSTFKGISSLEPATGKIQNYSSLDGLADGEFIRNSVFQAPNGELFFGGTNGLCSFYPEALTPNRHAPPVAVTGLWVMGQARSLQDSPDGQALLLNPEEHSFVVEFAALDFTTPLKNRYSFKLEGFDPQWSPPGTARRAAYSNLPPGRYTLRVIAANGDGVWNEQGLSLAVTVQAPFWRHLWFKVLVVAGVLAGLCLAIVLRLRFLHATRRELETTLAIQTDTLRQEVEKRTQVAEALSQSQRTFMDMFEFCPVALAISAIETGLIYQANTAFCTLVGYPADQVRGRTSIELGLFRDAPTRMAIVEKAIADKAVANHELLHVNRQGKKRTLLLTGALANVFGESCLLWLMSDITGRKELESALVAARERAEAANQAKSAFLANVSHEIRSPLNGILGLTELALRCNPTPDIRGYLEKIVSSSQVLLGVVNDILDISKIEAGKLELCPAAFRPRDILTRLEGMFAVKARDKGLVLTIEADPAVPETLMGDSLRLEQVLINIVGNAVKFTEHGVVEVRLSLLALENDEARLAFQVRDTGIGMDKEQLARVFEPFVQADVSTARRFGGTGLGLSIARRLFTLMGGVIAAHSEPDKGSLFRLEIALKLAPAELPESAGTPQSPLPPGPGGEQAPLEALVFDKAKALEPLMGNTIFLDRLLAGFRREYGHAGQRIQTMLSQGQTGEALALVEEIAGLAANLGGRILTEAARSLRADLAENGDTELLDPFLHALYEFLEATEGFKP